ncbi:hypothetical protein [Desulfocucumis palustris]|uniref:hypothetical protein n=1 Tax=Desulfocucumis palustris TaxID=1898651 RepID=UPI004039EB7D
MAGVMDLYGRTIVGFSMAEHMKKSLVIEALNQAIGRTGSKGGLLVHSDHRFLWIWTLFSWVSIHAPARGATKGADGH